MKKIVSIVLSFTLLFTLFGCSNSKYTKFSKSFLNLFDTASSIPRKLNLTKSIMSYTV